MSKLTYFVARHIPDPVRNEPRNVGVIVTDGARVTARFVGEVSCDGGLDLQLVSSSLVVDRMLYAEWHHVWRHLLTIDADALPTPPAGSPLDTQPPLHPRIAALVATSTHSFLVQPGGEWYVDTADLRRENIACLADDIFRRVVDPTAAEPATHLVANAGGKPRLIIWDR